MQLSKLDQIAHLEVWSPRYHDKTVLLACYKVDRLRTDHIKLTFPKAPSMAGDWYVSRKVVRRARITSNGTIMCYTVPLGKLEPLTINQKDWRSVI